MCNKITFPNAKSEKELRDDRMPEGREPFTSQYPKK
jgi:hypothetical protein